MKYQPFAYWLFAIILGIVLQHFYGFSQEFFVFALIISCLFYVCFFVLKFSKSLLFIAGFCVIICVGAIRYIQYNPAFPVEFKMTNQSQIYFVEVQNQLKPSEKYEKYYAKILTTESSIDSLILGQKVLIYLKKQEKPIYVKDRFWIYGKLNFIPSSQNPHAFDYQAYMRHKRIHLQIFTSDIASLERGNKYSLAYQLSSFKHKIKQELYNRDFSQTSIVFISSLALGDRSDLDNEFHEKLSSAGVMHLFAISGLHVGIVFGFLMIALYPLLYLPKGKIIRWIIALKLIWIFAWFVNFSPSVTRAVFMISFFYISNIFQKSTNLYHTLAITAFVLLFFQPNQLFDVGFQMSYSAVFFIAWLYKPVRNLFPRYRKPFKNYFFDLCTITTVAQFGVLPISVFYFNKFSGLFLIGNLVIIPFASTMVVLSLLTVFALAFDIFPQFLVRIFNFAFDSVLYFIDILTSFETLIFRGITWNFVQVLLLIIMLIMMRSVLLKFQWKKLIPIFCVLIVFQCTRLIGNYQNHLKHEFIVFHQYKGSIIGIREGKKLSVFWNVEDSLQALNYTINPYVISEKIKEVKIFDLWENQESQNYIKRGNILKIKEDLFYITDNTLTTFPEADILILTNSPYHIPKEIPLKTKRIIADGSNYPSQVFLLQQNFQDVYSTNENGAYLESIH